VLREDEVAVDLDVEDPTPARDELGFDPVLGLDPARQTGGLGRVVSTRAVGDSDLHASSMPFGARCFMKPNM
jgi:hypothetical protein